MSDSDTVTRLEGLEVRYAHVENALEVLTKTVLSLEQTVKRQTDQIKKLEQQIRVLQHSNISTIEDEKPPHY